VVSHVGDNLSVKLVSFTKDPVESIYAAWQSSKTDNPLLTVDDIKQQIADGKLTLAEISALLFKIIEMDIPIGRFISMIFIFEGMHIALREQFVREKMGWEFWLQSGRIRDQSTFFDDGWYHVPESIIRAQEQFLKQFPDHYDPLIGGPLGLFLGNLKGQQEAYKALVTDFKVPHEDARELIGLALTHKGGASTNITGLRHTISKRSCQILQLGNWEPFVMGLIEETATKIHPGFRTLASPPCMKGDNFMGCPYNLDNERRVSGEDKLAPCSLWMSKVYTPRIVEEGKSFIPTVGPNFLPITLWDKINDKKPSPEYGRTTIKKYEKFWGRDPWTGKLHLKVV
jgi:hypothetical protein